MAELPPPAPRIGGRAQLPDLNLLPPVGSVLPQRQRQQEPRGRYDFTPPQVPAAILEDEPLIHQGVLHHQGVFNNIQPVQPPQLQGLPEDEVVPLADVDENLVGEDAPAGGDQEHQGQDAGGDGLDENPEALGAPGLPIAPFVQHGIDANGAPADDVDPVQQPAAPVNGLDEDSDLPIAESPLVHSRSLPDHIQAEMSELAATLSPDNAAGEVDLYILLQRARAEINRLRIRLTSDADTSTRQAGLIRRSLKAIALGIERAGVKQGWASLARKIKSGGKHADIASGGHSNVVDNMA